MGHDAVILSPDFDDAVLSSWHVLASTSDVLVVNVFAGESPVRTLGWWDRLAGADGSVAAVRGRLEEDRQALALAGRFAVNLLFLDSQYRQRDQTPGKIGDALRGVNGRTREVTRGEEQRRGEPSRKPRRRRRPRYG